MDSELQAFKTEQSLAAPRSARKVMMFFAPEPEPKRPLILFHHVPKTAGTSLRRVILRDLRDYEEVDEEIDLSSTAPKGPNVEVQEWFRSAYEALGKRNQLRLRMVTGHTAINLLPSLKRRQYAVTILREPVDRMVSRWHFANRPQNETPKGEREPGAGARTLRSGTLPELLERFGGASPRNSPENSTAQTLFNGQARALMAPWFDTSELLYTYSPPPEADLWRRRLAEVTSRFGMIGVTDRFDETVGAIRHELGWGALPKAPQDKRNPSRPRLAELPEQFIEDARQYNWLDTELYRLACSELDRRLSGDRRVGARG